MEDSELKDQILKAVRRYAEGIRRDDVRSQLSYEDCLRDWIFTRLRVATEGIRKMSADFGEMGIHISSSADALIRKIEEPPKQ